jgi:hypothetical protein
VSGPRRALARLRTGAFVVFHQGGTVTRVMQSSKRCSSRLLVTMRVAVDGATPEAVSNLSVGELEEIVKAVRELADDYEMLSRERAAGRKS